MKRNVRRELVFLLTLLLAAAGISMEAKAEGTVFTAAREFDPFDWDSYGEVPFALFSAYGYEDSYGSELSAEQRQIYAGLEAYYLDTDKNFSNGTTAAMDFSYPEVYTAGTEEDYAALKDQLFFDSSYAYWAFVYDHPEVYWAGKVAMGLLGTVNNGNYRVTGMRFTISEKYSGAQSEISAYRAGVEAAAAKIRTNAESSDRQDVLRAIHDWLCSTLSYNYDAVSSENTDNAACKYAYSNGAVFTGRYSVVCQGYAEAFKVLADQFEIPCADILGKASGTTHMWNYVQMENENWYAVDCTWDDRTPVSYTYFLCGADSMGFQDTFRNEHAETPCFSTNENITFIYPTLSSEAYVKETVPACEHSDWEWKIVREPDCMTEGAQDKICKICGVTIDTEKIPATKCFDDGCTLSIAQNSWGYTGSAVEPEITFLYNGQAVDPDCYEVVYSDNISVGTGSVSVHGRNGYEGTLTASFTITKGTVKISLKEKTVSYTGKVIAIDEASVTSGAGKVTYTYYTDAKCTKKTSKSKDGASGSGKAPKHAGVYYVCASVASDSNYNSARSSAVKLTIKPGRAVLSGVKNISGKKIQVKWPGKTGTGTASGIKYVIEYSTDKTFKSKVKEVTISGNRKSCTISKLKKGRTYYVRIKVYAARQKVYGKASKVRKVKITK